MTSKSIAGATSQAPSLLVVPVVEHLPSFVAALERGWSPDNTRLDAWREVLASIERDAAAYLASMTDREALGPPILLPDGTLAPRLPGLMRWMWEDGFVGSVGFRWQAGTAALPPTCLGHIGYTVVPWRRGLGYATRGLREMLPVARVEGLPYVELTTREQNLASQRVIIANGGIMHERFVEPHELGAQASLRYRIALT